MTSSGGPNTNVPLQKLFYHFQRRNLYQRIPLTLTQGKGTATDLRLGRKPRATLRSKLGLDNNILP